MTDLSHLSISELRALADAEIERRRLQCKQEAEALCARHGFDLSDIAGAPKKRGDDGRRPYGSVLPRIEPMLRSGVAPKEIADAFGWKNTGAVYAYARKLGISVTTRRAA